GRRARVGGCDRAKVFGRVVGPRAVAVGAIGIGQTRRTKRPVALARARARRADAAFLRPQRLTARVESAVRVAGATTSAEAVAGRVGHTMRAVRRLVAELESVRVRVVSRVSDASRHGLVGLVGQGAGLEAVDVVEGIEDALRVDAVISASDAVE